MNTQFVSAETEKITQQFASMNQNASQVRVNGGHVEESAYDRLQKQDSQLSAVLARVDVMHAQIAGVLTYLSEDAKVRGVERASYDNIAKDFDKLFGFTSVSRRDTAELATQLKDLSKKINEAIYLGNRSVARTAFNAVSFQQATYSKKTTDI